MYHTVALDNITLRTEDIADMDHATLILLAEMVNLEMEKPKMLKALEDLILFGHCEVEL